MLFQALFHVQVFILPTMLHQVLEKERKHIFLNLKNIHRCDMFTLRERPSPVSCGEDTCVNCAGFTAQPPSLPEHHVVYKEAILTESPCCL